MFLTVLAASSIAFWVASCQPSFELPINWIIFTTINSTPPQRIEVSKHFSLSARTAKQKRYLKLLSFSMYLSVCKNVAGKIKTEAEVKLKSGRR
jgi:hypothetical protein